MRTERTQTGLHRTGSESCKHQILSGSLCALLGGKWANLSGLPSCVSVVLCPELVICFFWKPWFEQDDRSPLAPRVLVLGPPVCMEEQQAMSADEPIGPASERVPRGFRAFCEWPEHTRLNCCVHSRRSSVTSMLYQFFRVPSRKQETSRSSPCSHQIFSLPEGPRSTAAQLSCSGGTLAKESKVSPQSPQTGRIHCFALLKERHSAEAHQKPLYVSEECNASRVLSRWLEHIGLHSVVGYVRTGTA